VNSKLYYKISGIVAIAVVAASFINSAERLKENFGCN